jgi:hypothetical protein
VRTAREHFQYALGAARVWRLNDGEARMYAAVAAHVDEHGECTVGNERLALLVDRHIDTARKLLRRLRRLGLIDRVERGNKRVLKLRTDRLPAEQLELDLARLEASETAARVGAQAPRASSAHLGAQAPGPPGRSGAHQKLTEGIRSGESAREHAPGLLSDAAPHFEQVLTVLAEAKPDEILIDDRAILAALEAHPETAGYDHVKAAQQVVMWTHDPCGGPSIASAPRLLWSVLDKQRPPQATTSGDAKRAGRPARDGQGEPERPWWDGALARAMTDQPSASEVPA